MRIERINIILNYFDDCNFRIKKNSKLNVTIKILRSRYSFLYSELPVYCMQNAYAIALGIRLRLLFFIIESLCSAQSENVVLWVAHSHPTLLLPFPACYRDESELFSSR